MTETILSKAESCPTPPTTNTNARTHARARAHTGTLTQTLTHLRTYATQTDRAQPTETKSLTDCKGSRIALWTQCIPPEPACMHACTCSSSHSRPHHRAADAIISLHTPAAGWSGLYILCSCTAHLSIEEVSSLVDTSCAALHHFSGCRSICCGRRQVTINAHVACAGQTGLLPCCIVTSSSLIIIARLQRSQAAQAVPCRSSNGGHGNSDKGSNVIGS